MGTSPTGNAASVAIGPSAVSAVADVADVAGDAEVLDEATMVPATVVLAGKRPRKMVLRRVRAPKVAEAPDRTDQRSHPGPERHPRDKATVPTMITIRAQGVVMRASTRVVKTSKHIARAMRAGSGASLKQPHLHLTQRMQSPTQRRTSSLPPLLRRRVRAAQLNRLWSGRQCRLPGRAIAAETSRSENGR